MSSSFFKTTIGEQVTLQRGFDITKKDQIDGVVPVISSGGISSYHNEAKLSGPGVILGRKGSLGTVFYIDGPYWPHDTTLWVKDFKNNNPSFVYYFFKSISHELKSMDVGAANPALNRNHVHPLEIYWPTRNIQDQIADILSSVDAKIENNTKINQTLEKMVEALFKSWFVYFDPVKAKIAAIQAGSSHEDQTLAAMVSISGKDIDTLAIFKLEHPEKYAELKDFAEQFPSAMQDSELGEIPLGWTLSEIGNEVDVVGGATPSTKTPVFWDKGNINWTTPKDLSDLKDKILLKTERKITVDGLKKISSGLLPINTVLMSSRAPVGYLALTKIPVAINQGYIAMKCNHDLSPEFILQWCSANMSEILSRASGTTFAEISKKNFNSIPLVKPSVSSVSYYTKQSSSIYSLIEANVQENHYLKEIRDALIIKLISSEMKLDRSM
ncbi:restriction endonuclease subunit S [Serratia nevei]|uniref:restriction endonuclease subunit S n=1 Tax=Serratia nevei TaxID=2703794 RepID=UPI003FA77F72